MPLENEVTNNSRHRRQTCDTGGNRPRGLKEKHAGAEQRSEARNRYDVVHLLCALAGNLHFRLSFAIGFGSFVHTCAV